MYVDDENIVRFDSCRPMVDNRPRERYPQFDPVEQVLARYGDYENFPEDWL